VAKERPEVVMAAFGVGTTDTRATPWRYSAHVEKRSPSCWIRSNAYEQLEELRNRGWFRRLIKAIAGFFKRLFSKRKAR